MKRIIWWCRRDFRLKDNTALSMALQDAEEVLPVFVLDDRLLYSARVRGPRLAWMLDGLRVFDADLRQHGARLIVRRGDPAAELAALCRETGAEAVYLNRDYSPYATRRDAQVAAVLNKTGFLVETFKDLVIHEQGEIRGQQGKPYEVYTPYHKAWEKLPKPAILSLPQKLFKLRADDAISSLPIPTAVELDCSAVPQPIAMPGEHNAVARLEAFANAAIWQYSSGRDLLGMDGTALLSPYLRWGMISPRQCYWRAQQALHEAETEAAQQSVLTWIRELIWRDFNYEILARAPHIVRRNYQALYDVLAWQNRADWFAAWQAGQTGYPVVDAAMRQLRTTGWVHNRARMIVASFLCKDLLIDWHWGEHYFMANLLDGDVANNVGGWQWTAGTGTDAAPYFRIFNPTTQSEKFDPGGHYIQRWLPELANVPTRYIHTPHLMPAEQQKQAGCIIGKHYPQPLVNHNYQRGLALALYGAARDVIV